MYLPDNFCIHPTTLGDPKLDARKKIALTYVMLRQRHYNGQMRHYTRVSHIARLLSVSKTVAQKIAKELVDDRYMVCVSINQRMLYFLHSYDLFTKYGISLPDRSVKNRAISL